MATPSISSPREEPIVRPTWLETTFVNRQHMVGTVAVAVCWTSWLLSLWVLFLQLSVADAKTLSMWISSDTLYPVNVITDTVIDGHSLSGWRFSIAPCWFPDLVATWIFMVLTRNVIAATLLAGFMQTGLLVLGLKCAWRATGYAVAPIQEALGLAAAIAITLHVALHPGLYYPGLYQFFLPQTHVGSLLVVIYALALALSILRQKHQNDSTNWSIVSCYGVVCVLGGMSNLLFSAHMLGPLTVTTVAAAFLGLLAWRAIGFVLAVGWAGMAVGWVLNRTAFHTTDVSAQSERSFERLMVSLDTFARGFVQNTGDLDGLHLVAIVSLIICAAVVLLMLREAILGGLERLDISARLIAVLFGVFGLSALLGMVAIVAGGSNGLAVFKDYHWSMHYLHPAFLLPLFSLPFAAGAMIYSFTKAHRAVSTGVVLGLGVTSLSIAGAYTLRAPSAKAYVTQHRPPLVEYLDTLAAKEGLKTGVAGYWQARVVTLLSRTGLRAYAVTGDLDPHLWVGNTEWYEPIYNKGQPRPDFVVLDDPQLKLDAPPAYTKFGFPLRETQFEDTRVLLYQCATCTQAERAAAAARRNMDQPLTVFLQKLTSPRGQVTAGPAEQLRIPITLTNTGTQAWISNGRYPITASYKFYKGGSMLPLEGERTTLPKVVDPGETVSFNLRVVMPTDHGEYQVRVTLVQEGVAWFMFRGGESLNLPIVVESQSNR